MNEPRGALATAKALDLIGRDEPPMATCPRDGEPLIATMAFSKAEFYCLVCGGHFGFLSPRAAESTPELQARYEALQAEWDEHVGGKLISSGGYRTDCEKCKGFNQSHSAHATDEERTAHDTAIAWLDARKGQAT